MQDTPQHFVNEWVGRTTLHPLAAVMLLALGVTMLMVPRRYAVWPMIMMACFVPQAQRLMIGPFNFDLLRLMLLFGTARIAFMQEWRRFNWIALDWAVLALAAAHLFFGLIRVGPSILINELGCAYDAIGMYFIFRMLVRDWDDVRSTATGFALISLPVATAFAIEQMTGRNMFAVFGGVDAITMIRENRLRCEGAYSHPILAGLFWASLLPVVAMGWWDGGGRRLLAAAAVGASLFIIVACASATPVTAVLFATLGACAFIGRYRMRWVRWGAVVTLCGLHIVMKAPVWHLISRIDLVGGNSGYHRYQLIDGAIRHWDEWWLMGTMVGTEHWGESTYDVTNTYLMYGLHGGVCLLALFVGLLALAFRAVGRVWRSEMNDRLRLLWSWALGVSLFVHCTSFLVISYFGQISMLWYLLLATIGSMDGARRAFALQADRMLARGWVTIVPVDRRASPAM